MYTLLPINFSKQIVIGTIQNRILNNKKETERILILIFFIIYQVLRKIEMRASWPGHPIIKKSKKIEGLTLIKYSRNKVLTSFQISCERRNVHCHLSIRRFGLKTWRSFFFPWKGQVLVQSPKTKRLYHTPSVPKLLTFLGLRVILDLLISFYL